MIAGSAFRRICGCGASAGDLCYAPGGIPKRFCARSLWLLGVVSTKGRRSICKRIRRLLGQQGCDERSAIWRLHERARLVLATDRTTTDCDFNGTAALNIVVARFNRVS
jgi:hypothetical protein